MKPDATFSGLSKNNLSQMTEFLGIFLIIHISEEDSFATFHATTKLWSPFNQLLMTFSLLSDKLLPTHSLLEAL